MSLTCRGRMRAALPYVALALIAMLFAPSGGGLSPVSPAFADDGDSDGGGGGGGSDGGPSDAWRPFADTKTRRFRMPARPRVVRPRQPREILARNLSPQALAELERRRFRVLDARQSGTLGAPIARLAIPPRSTAAQALEIAKDVAPDVSFTENDEFQTLRPNFRTAGEGCARACAPFVLTNWQAPIGRCAARARIGMIDTGVDRDHPALSGSRIEFAVTRGPDRKPSAKTHGTGVASLLVGDVANEFSGTAPGATIIAVDAFHGGPEGDRGDTFDLIAAIDLLTTQRVRIINMSFAGPDNVFLREAIEMAQKAGIVIVAAAGSRDSSNRLGYPARYPDVIAVTAVDRRLRPSSRSAQGAHISFAAPGAGIRVAKPGSGYSDVEGSSFAAPFVTAAFAMALQSVNNGEQATRLIASAAKDLGAPGRDPVFGYGLVQFSALPPC